jgi:hydroxymethylglutaryl-CoA lyase
MADAMVKLIECPRDAIQGWPHPVPTAVKLEYMNALLEVGFDTLDCGSFVSPKAIPQMADTASIIPLLNTQTDTRLLTIVANERGAKEALHFPGIHYLGFPFSVSETFQQRNTNSSIADSLKRVEAIQALCRQHERELVVYLSMGFGNPYGDPYSESIVADWALQLHALGIRTLSLADTVGVASPDQVERITAYLVKHLPDTEIGVHLHSTAANWSQKLEAAYTAGCRRFDGALLGIGGCPMAKDELVGNMNTVWMLEWFAAKGVLPAMNQPALAKALTLANQIFQ